MLDVVHITTYYKWLTNKQKNLDWIFFFLFLLFSCILVSSTQNVYILQRVYGMILMLHVFYQFYFLHVFYMFINSLTQFQLLLCCCRWWCYDLSSRNNQTMPQVTNHLLVFEKNIEIAKISIALFSDMYVIRSLSEYNLETLWTINNEKPQDKTIYGIRN